MKKEIEKEKTERTLLSKKEATLPEPC